MNQHVSPARLRFATRATAGLLARAGLPGGERNEFSGMTLRELVAESIAAAGGRPHSMDARTMVGVGLGLPGAGITMSSGQASTSDFANILANVANKAMLKGYEEADETFDQWTAKGSLSDFKPQKRVDLGLFPTLSSIQEGAEYTHATISDRGETIQLATYGKMFAITRQSIINDDLDAFTRIPMRMGRAAKRTIGDLVYAVLTSNPTMSDGVALFHASHGNLAPTGSAMSVASLDDARARMMKQKDPDGIAQALNIRPMWIIVPVALEGTARVLMDSEKDPGVLNVNAARPNYMRGMAKVVSDARLDVASTSAWYLAADGAQHDTIEVSYLYGNDKPYIEQQQGWNVDGLEFKVRIDAGVKALDHRTMHKNAGQ